MLQVCKSMGYLHLKMSNNHNQIHFKEYPQQCFPQREHVVVYHPVLCP